MHKYLDVDVFNTLVRPQYSTSCSITSITSGFNYLFSSGSSQRFSQEDFASMVGKNIRKREFNPGNRLIGNWSKTIAQKFGVKIKVDILFEGGWGLYSAENNLYWNQMKTLIKDKKSFLILHAERHYTPIMGYATYPDTPRSTNLDGNRWIFIADVSPYHRKCRIARHHFSVSPPVWSIRWGAIRKQFNHKAYYGIICLSKR